MTQISRYNDLLKKSFTARLEEKSSWGRLQVKELFLESQIDALSELNAAQSQAYTEYPEKAIQKEGIPKPPET